MSAYIDITLGEVKTHYRTTYPIARAVEVLLHHSKDVVEEDPQDEGVTIKFETKQERDEFIEAIRAAVRKAIEEEKHEKK